VKRRNVLIVLSVLSVLAAVLLLDIAVALLPAIIPDAAAAEREAISAVLQDHAGQLLILFASIGSMAIALRHEGRALLDPDKKDGEE
jgi:hypothetical protein